MEESTEKLCSCCRVTKLAHNFSKDRDSKDGLNHICRPCSNKRVQRWRIDNPDKAKALQSRRNKDLQRDRNKQRWARIKADPILHAAKKEELMLYARAKRIEDPVRATERGRIYQRRIRWEVITYYSGGTNECACCKESHYEFLTIDHINGGGYQHRKEVKNVYAWMRRNNFPEGFRVLCMNCNHALGRYGFCPHERSSN